MVTQLFSPLSLGAPKGPGLELRNRALVAPMCMYSAEAEDGVPTGWHQQHLGALAAGGFGMVVVEATGVEPAGRISPRDLGIWNDPQQAKHADIVRFIHSQGAAAALQLGHAGGKGSTQPGLLGFPSGSVPVAEGGWQTQSAVEGPVMPDLAPSVACSDSDLERIVRAFTQAAVRADQAGYDVIQILGAHGYLLHQFLSPLTNLRDDDYGGDERGRTRLLKRVMSSVRSVWPAHKPLGLRISGTDWVAGGWNIAASARLVTELAGDGLVNWVDVSSGGLGRGAKMRPAPGYQVSLAAEIKTAVSGLGTAISAVGLIDEPAQAETIVATGLADAVSIGRAALRNPHWATQAAADLGVPSDKLPQAPQYWRARW